MDRREAIKKSVLAMVGSRLAIRLAYLAVPGTLALEAFSCNEVLTILQDAEIGVDGIAPIVDLVDPALAPVITGFSNTFDAGVTAADGYYNAYEQALSSNGATVQTLHDEFLAALAALKATAAQLLGVAHVSNPAHQSVITNIIDAVIQEVLNVIGLFSHSSTSAALSPSEVKKQLKIEHNNFHTKLKGVLAYNTNDAALNAVCANINKKLK